MVTLFEQNIKLPTARRKQSDKKSPSLQVITTVTNQKSDHIWIQREVPFHKQTGRNEESPKFNCEDNIIHYQLIGADIGHLTDLVFKTPMLSLFEKVHPSLKRN